MKILMINYQALPLPPVKGGAIEYLIDEFLKYNDENQLHDITLYSIYDSEAEKESAKYKYTTVRYINIKSLFDKADRIIRHFINKYSNKYVGNTYIAKILRKEKNLNKYDMIIMENAPEFGLMIPESFKGKLILHLHNDRLNATTKQAKKILDKYDAVYTISDDLGKCVQSIEKSEKVKTLYNGVDLGKFKEDPELRTKMRSKYNVSDDDFLFMFCGRIVYDKGVLPLVRAFSEIKKKNVKLIIVGGIGYSQNGTNDYMKEIEKYTDENVIFTGFLPYEKMPEMYPMADVGVVPSIFNDPFNLTSIEFCANKIPIIISDRGAMKELVNDECAVIAKCDDNFVGNIKEAIEYMLNADITAMGEEAKKVSANFSIETYCERFKTLLEKGN